MVDKMDTGKLEETLKRTGIREQLRRRIMETYKETKNKVKVRNKRSAAKFWTRKGLRDTL